MRGIYGAVASVVAVAAACSDMGPDPTLPVGRRLIVSEIAACALDASNAVFCWGGNTTRWEYGSGSIAASRTPVAVPVPGLATLARGVGTHLCGITAQRRAVCWGRGGLGQLGGGVPGDTGNAATFVRGGLRFTDLWIGRLNTCGVTDEGRGMCWGANQRGEIGVAFVSMGEPTLSPIEVDGDLRFTQIMPGWFHGCAISADGRTLCWGANNRGQLGIDVTDGASHRTAVPLSGDVSLTQLSLGALHSCGLTADGTAYCWGANNTGQLGDGTTVSRSAPQRVATPEKFTAIATSSGFAGGSSLGLPFAEPGVVAHTCALTSAGAAYCWGWNGNGQLGDGTILNRLSPAAVGGGLTFSTIGLGGAYTCGMAGNRVWCWGSNSLGQLGNGSAVPRSVLPVSVGAPFNLP